MRRSKILALFVASACSDGSRSTTLRPVNDDAQDDTQPASPGGATLVTVPDRTVVTAGEMTLVRCWLSGPLVTVLAATAPGTAVIVSETGEAFPTHDGMTTFAPTRTGTYRLSCRDSEGEDPRGATVQVGPGAGHRWSIALPEERCLGTARSFAVRPEVTDRYGNEIRDGAFRVDAPGAEVRGPFVRFTGEGAQTIRVSYAGPTTDDTEIAPVERSFLVDATAPDLVIETPVRAAILSGNRTRTRVSGHVEDAISEVVRVARDGAGVELSAPNGSFVYEVEAHWGLNVLRVEAEDSCGNIAQASQAFLYSPSLLGPDEALDNAVVVSLGQDFLDDGRRDTDQIDQTVQIDDLVTLVDEVLARQDLAARLPPGQVLMERVPRNDCGGCPVGGSWVDVGLRVARHPSPQRRLVIEAPAVRELELKNGGLHLSIELGALDLPLRLRTTIAECALGCGTSQSITVDSTVGFDAVVADVTLWLDAGPAGVTAGVSDVAFDISGLYVNLDCGLLDGLCDWVTEAVLSAATGTLENLLADRIESAVAPALAQALSGPGIEKRLTLPPPATGSVDMTMGVATLHITPAHLRLGLSSLMQPVSVAPNAGALLWPETFDMNLPSQPLAMGLRIDTLNQLFWALWQEGALSLDGLPEGVGPDMPEGTQIALRALLPPVMTPETESGALSLGVGDLQLEALVNVGQLTGASDFWLNVQASVSVSAAVSVDINPETNELELLFDEEFQGAVELHNINDATIAGAMSEFLTSIVRTGLPELLRERFRKLALPEFPLAGLIPGATPWRLNEGELVQRQGYLLISGRLGP